MEVLKNMSTVKVVAEQGEEILHEVHDFKVASGKEVIVFAGVDGGSTQTRIILVDALSDNAAEELQQMYVVPSVSVTIPDSRTIKEKSESLYDNMDSFIVNSATVSEKPFTSERLVRGTKALDVNFKENRLDSSTQKTSNPIFYKNIIDSLGYSLCLKYGNQIPEKVKVYLSVALPPDDMNEINLKKFIKNFSKFIWKHNKSGVEINIDVLGVRASTEPEAFVKAYYALQGGDIPENVMHIEGGGRSIGVEILKNGNSLYTAQKTLEYGGSQLLDDLNSEYVNRHGGSQLKRSMLERAIRVGKLKLGNSDIDVVDLIEQVKAQMAEKIRHDIVINVFDKQNQVSVTELNVISMSGRLFSEGEYEISLAKFVEEQFRKLTPHTEFLHITDNLIPTGLVLLAILDFSKNVGEAEVAETVDHAEEVRNPEEPTVINQTFGGEVTDTEE